MPRFPDDLFPPGFRPDERADLGGPGPDLGAGSVGDVAGPGGTDAPVGPGGTETPKITPKDLEVAERDALAFSERALVEAEQAFQERLGPARAEALGGDRTALTRLMEGFEQDAKTAMDEPVPLADELLVPGFRDLRARLRSETARVATEARVGRRLENLTRSVEAGEALLRRDPSRLAEVLNRCREAVLKATLIPEAEQIRLDTARRHLTSAAVTGLIDQDPAAVRDRLEAGEFDGLLDPDMKNQHLMEAASAVRSRAANEARQAREREIGDRALLRRAIGEELAGLRETGRRPGRVQDFEITEMLPKEADAILESFARERETHLARQAVTATTPEEDDDLLAKAEQGAIPAQAPVSAGVLRAAVEEKRQGLAEDPAGFVQAAVDEQIRRLFGDDLDDLDQTELRRLRTIFGDEIQRSLGVAEPRAFDTAETAAAQAQLDTLPEDQRQAAIAEIAAAKGIEPDRVERELATPAETPLRGTEQDGFEAEDGAAGSEPSPAEFTAANDTDKADAEADDVPGSRRFELPDGSLLIVEEPSETAMVGEGGVGAGDDEPRFILRQSDGSEKAIQEDELAALGLLSEDIVGVPDEPPDELTRAAGEFVASLLPGVGEALSARDAYLAVRAARAALDDDRIGDALLEGGVAFVSALGAIPGFGALARLPKATVRLIGRTAAALRPMVEQGSKIARRTGRRGQETVARQGREISRQWFGRWVDNILGGKVKPQGKAARVGRMSPKVEDFLKARSIDPGDGAITIVDTSLRRMQRGSKAKSQVLPRAFIRNMQDALEAPRAVLWDQGDRALLYVFDVPEDRLGKFVVRMKIEEIQRGDKKVRKSSNFIKSGGQVPARNPRNQPNLTVVDGDP